MNVIKFVSVLLVGFSLLNSCRTVTELDIKPAPVSSIEFRKSLEEIGGTKVHSGNSIKKYVNGEEFFPAMRNDMKLAKTSIYFEMYIFREGKVMSEYSEILTQKAKSGVDVRLIGDELGCNRISKQDMEKMLAAGVQLEIFNPMLKNIFSANNRDHKKYFIVDGKVGYTGGAGMADKWLGDGDSDDEWRDNMYRVEGPAVVDMQKSFVTNWNSITKDNLKIGKYANVSKGKAWVQDVSSDPKSNKMRIGHSYLHSIRSAQDSIYIQMAYTCPPGFIEEALIEAQKRGVKVKVIIPSKNTDAPVTRRCGHNLWRKLIKTGIEVWEYTPANMHVKAVVIDRTFSIVGAANLDHRSFKINYENNLHVFDEKLAKKHISQFYKDLQSCVKLDSKNVEKFSILGYLFQSQL